MVTYGTTLLADACAAAWAHVRVLAAREFGDADADDITQETMLRLLSRDAGEPAAWWPSLLATLHEVGGEARAQRARRAAEEVGLLGLPPGPDSSSQVPLARDLHRRLADAWEALNPSDRLAFALYEVSGLSGADVAHRCGITVNAVRQRVFRARQVLAASLGPLDA